MRGGDSRASPNPNLSGTRLTLSGTRGRVPPGLPILYWHDVCHTALGKLHHTLGHDETYQEQLSQEAANEFFGRFNIWARNIGAGQRGHASLDYRLCEATEIRAEVVHVLQYLAKALQAGKSIPTISNDHA